MAKAPNPKKTLTDAEKAKRDKEHADNFTKLINKRMNKTIASLVIVKRLANPRNYRFTDDQVNKIEDALSSSVADTVKAFRNALRGGGTVTGSSFDITKSPQ